MGAVLLLVFLPLLMAVLAFVSVGGVAGILFVALAAFVLGSLLYQARDWDHA